MRRRRREDATFYLEAAKLIDRLEQDSLRPPGRAIFEPRLAMQPRYYYSRRQERTTQAARLCLQDVCFSACERPPGGLSELASSSKPWSMAETRPSRYLKNLCQQGDLERRFYCRRRMPFLRSLLLETVGCRLRQTRSTSSERMQCEPLPRQMSFLSGLANAPKAEASLFSGGLDASWFRNPGLLGAAVLSGHGFLTSLAVFRP